MEIRAQIFAECKRDAVDSSKGVELGVEHGKISIRDEENPPPLTVDPHRTGHPLCAKCADPGNFIRGQISSSKNKEGEGNGSSDGIHTRVDLAPNRLGLTTPLPTSTPSSFSNIIAKFASHFYNSRARVPQCRSYVEVVRAEPSAVMDRGGGT